jgi:hypothetical protein
MAFPDCFAANWYSLVEAAGIIGSLIFTAVSFRADTKARRIGNLLKLTEQQRDIWRELLHRPELSRVLDPKPDLEVKPITQEEELFVGFLILHLNSAFQAICDGMFASPEGLKADVREFFAYPISKAIWDKIKLFQDKNFVRFIEDCLRERK